ncbi:MAG: MFS transporter [Ignavibacterium sp.]|nr:MAG: MFS transporter [Ignavibacterium sp.]
MKHPWSGLRNIPRNIWLISVTALINRAGMMVLPFMALYAVEELEVSPAKAGLILAFYGIGAFISAPFAGKLSDRLGAVILMRISLIGSGLFLIIYSFVTSFIAFLLLTLIWAVIAEAFRPASMSFISDEVPAERRKTAFALNRLAINLGMSVGPVFGGILSTINFSLLFYVDGLTSIAAGVYLIFCGIKDRTSVETEPQTNIEDELPKKKFSILSNRKFLYYLIAIIPVQIVFFQHIGSLPIFIVEQLMFSKSTFGFLMAINTVMIILIEVPLNDAMRMWPDWKALMLGAILTGIGFGLTIFGFNSYILIFSIVLWTFGEMIFFPSAGNYVAEHSPENMRGEYMGYFQMTFSFSFMIGPLLGTIVLEEFGATVVWTGTFILGMITAAMMLNLKSKKG